MPHLIDALPFVLPVVIGLWLAVIYRNFWPIGWLAWAATMVVRLLALLGTLTLCFLAWTAWQGGFEAVAHVDWSTLTVLLIVTLAMIPLMLAFDVVPQVKRRRTARSKAELGVRPISPNHRFQP